MNTITIAGRSIGPGFSPYMIAELSANHGGDLERAKRIIDLSAKAGADAVKFQVYTADSLTLDANRPDFHIEGGLWDGERLYDLYARAATPYEWFPTLFAHARAQGITPFASVFDIAGIALMEMLEAPAYKIASFEAVDLELVAACAATGKPTIISTGLCAVEDIADAVEAFRKAGGRDLILLRCNSSYPADPSEANLAAIPDMAARFGVPVGYSDHTLDAIQAVCAVALGACVVEKHVIDTREPATADSAFSSTEEQFVELVRSCRAAFLARGRITYGPDAGEMKSLAFRRSLYASQPIGCGEVFSRDNIRSVRPGHGLPPKALPTVLGRHATRDIAAGEPLSWDMVG
ncbi:N-acetylneuraminate synthase [Azospirillum fermentarium]|uniref:pseudaminic acid synthase n=1 Tax=Azospirillum fermentarium TaxID=1233114 RepID=UPI002226A5A2|nr:pseudaminic acid synthase [Azospirillum fermentarium]MCW2249513.1 N-acetylneuraminate synthase [Azospirillum fermentarium]